MPAITKQTVPPIDATPEEKRNAQKARAKEFGIEALETGANLSYPKGFPTKLSDYGDPVNLKFPFETASRARNARVRFKQFADQIYSQTKSKAIIHERIVRAELKYGIKPEIDSNDPLDKLLPAGLREQLQKAVVSGQTSLDDGHRHEAEVDDQTGNGVTSEVNGHRHQIEAWDVREADGHSHDLEIDRYKNALLLSLIELKRQLKRINKTKNILEEKYQKQRNINKFA